MNEQAPVRIGGRPAAQPPPMTLNEWKAAGCPALKLSVMQVAEWAGISRSRANDYVVRKVLHRIDAEKKIPTDHPGNQMWLLDRVGYEKSDMLAPGRPAGVPQKSGYTVPPRSETADSATGTLDLEVILDAISRMDLTALPSAAMQKVARLESAFKTRVERETKQGMLIERSLVSTCFNRLYQIDTNELRTIGAKVAPDIAATLGAEDPETQLRIEKRIDDEILKVLAHIKRLMDDFLRGLGSAPTESV